jgi:hypothetical protein
MTWPLIHFLVIEARAQLAGLGLVDAGDRTGRADSVSG